MQSLWLCWQASLCFAYCLMVDDAAKPGVTARVIEDFPARTTPFPRFFGAPMRAVLCTNTGLHHEAVNISVQAWQN